MIKSNRAAALRWLAGNVGRHVDTVQRDPDGAIRWAPGARVLQQMSSQQYALNRSYMPLESRNRFFVTGDTLTIETINCFGDVWHVTAYSLVKSV